MKKIISLFAALAMVATTFVSSVSAAYDAELPAKIKIVTSQPEKIPASEIINNCVVDGTMSMKVADGYSAYKVTVSLENVGGLAQTAEDENTGKLLRSIFYQLKFKDSSKFKTTKSYSKIGDSSKYTAGQCVGWSANKDLFTAADAQFYPYTDEAYLEVTDLSNFYVLYFVVEDGAVATATIDTDNTCIVLGKYTNGIDDATQKYALSNSRLEYNTTTLTFGQPADVKVSSITVNANDTMVNGTTQTATATVAPEGATNREVTWSVENGTGAATITASGVITATRAGTVTVKATAKDGSNVCGTKTITITEPAPTKPTVAVSTKVGNSGKSWAWLLTITNHMTGFDYKGQFKSGRDTENVDINVDGIAGSAEFRKIIVLETEKTNPTFTAKAEAVN